MIEWLTNRWKAGGLKCCFVRSEGLGLRDASVVSVDQIGIVATAQGKIYAVPWGQLRFVEINDD